MIEAITAINLILSLYIYSKMTDYVVTFHEELQMQETRINALQNLLLDSTETE